jgi:peptide/nickel transport system substrate-binding protein
MRSYRQVLSPHRGTRVRCRPPVLVAALAAMSLGLAACSGGTSSGDSPGQRKPSNKVGDTLTMVSVTSPQTLDPAKAVQTDSYFEELAYAPLIVRRSDGSLTPGLATSWSYTGAGNTTFVLHLRPGVMFSDGSALTAQTVVDHLKYVVASNGQMAPLLATNTFTATDPLTVTITAKTPNPNFPDLLTQDYVVGGVIAPTGLKSPAQLGTRTLGAGPYQLDPAQTVSGDHYTYVANPNFYDKASVHWRKVVIRVITNPQAVVNALKTGQADIAQGDPSTLSSARSAGLTVTSAPQLWLAVILADRNGKLAKPLADVRVRQALNYATDRDATDRDAIAKALFAGVGDPTTQPTVPGGYGSDTGLNNTYPYDVNKAKDMLAAAGYPNGFTLKMATPEYQQLNLIAQALAQQWKKAGVTVQLTDEANPSQYSSATFGGQFPSFMVAFGNIPMWMQGPSLFLPSAAFNPFHVADPALQALADQQAKAPDSQRDQLDQQIEAFLVNKAWFVPVVTTGLPFYARKTVTGTATSAKAALLPLYEIQPAA